MARSLAARTALLEARQRQAFYVRALAEGNDEEAARWWRDVFYPVRHQVNATIQDTGDGYEFTRQTVEVLVELFGCTPGVALDWLTDQFLAFPADQRTHPDATREQVRAGLAEQLGVNV
jgi:hypothetical protein